MGWKLCKLCSCRNTEVCSLQMDSDLLGRYTKLQERLKAERRALKILRTSAAEERGLRAQNLLTEAALPCVVGETVLGCAPSFRCLSS